MSFIQSGLNIQCWNNNVSLYRLNYTVISTCKFHKAEWCNLTACRCRTWYRYFFGNADTAVSQSLLLHLCYSSIITAAISVILFLTMVQWTLLSSVHVWKVFFLISCQHGSAKLKARSVHGLATMHCCQLKINFMLHVICLTDVTIVALEAEWPHGTRSAQVPPICNQSSPMSIKDFSTSILILAVSDFWQHPMRHVYHH